ncbi:MAG: DUF4382 domain-containing protein [Acidobacteria bacterium]|nr:DUF4382 domain-containing protein [Acidobacteriota bacterium]
MLRHRNSLVFACAIILMMLPLVSCSNGGYTEGPSTGTLELSLIDSPNPYHAIYITINEIRVHHDVDGWETLSNLDLDLPQTVNLLELVNGAMAYLGSTELTAGHYSQMRLILEDSEEAPQSADLNILGNPHPYFNYLIDAWDNEISLKVPSGGNSGIKLVNGFDIEAESATELILDFDALKSVVQAGNSGKWLLKPTIKVIETVTNKVSGKITDAADAMEIEAAMVTAQKNDEEPVLPDEADRVTVAAGTESDEFGDYFMYLPLLAATEDPYNIVVTMTGYAAACQQLPSNETMAYTADFALTALTAEETGTLSASVEGLADENDSALFSIRQNHIDCGVIEVASFSVVNTMPSEQNLIYSDPIVLPTGIYQIVVSADGQPTQVVDLEVEDDDYEIDVAF